MNCQLPRAAGYSTWQPSVWHIDVYIAGVSMQAIYACAIQESSSLDSASPD